MVEWFLHDRVALYCGDCRDQLPHFPDNHFDSVVTDAPYHLQSIHERFAAKGRDETSERYAAGPYGRHATGFMGQQWDGGDVAFNAETWRAAYRVLKPGGHLVAFGGTRTYDMMVTGIRAAGFEIRDSILNLIASDRHVVDFLDSLDDEQRGAFARCIEESQFGGLLAWVFGQGFPKSHDVAKSIDRAAGITREDKFEGSFQRRAGPTGNRRCDDCGKWLISGDPCRCPRPQDRAVTDAAREWQGWGTALKPAFEPIVLARKPLSEGTVAANVLRWRTGALNIDACRIETAENLNGGAYAVRGAREPMPGDERDGAALGMFQPGKTTGQEYSKPTGRWPANVVHDGSDDVLAAFPETESGRLQTHHRRSGGSQIGTFEIRERTGEPCDWGGDKGSAARFFASFNGRDGEASAERRYTNEGATGTRREPTTADRFFYTAKADADDRVGSKHPTVKPLDLMQWLVRLVTPKGGKVLDPFAGTGTTGEAAFREGMHAVLIEREAAYCDDIRRRMKLVLAGPDERRRESIKHKTKDKPVDHGPLFAEPSVDHSMREIKARMGEIERGEE